MPRWKIFVELVFACLLAGIGGVVLSYAFNSGPLWEWFIGIVLLWMGLNRVRRGWKQL